jgi:flavin reductase (DIM6/NTAB) family NADH-FMN oxidoreductase RutF
MIAILLQPIAFVSTVGKDEFFNLAHFSCFATGSPKPAFIYLEFWYRRGGRREDTLKKIEFFKDFVINVVSKSRGSQTLCRFHSDLRQQFFLYRG